MTLVGTLMLAVFPSTETTHHPGAQLQIDEHSVARTQFDALRPTALGRKQTFILELSSRFERLLWVKAAISGLVNRLVKR